MMPDTEALKVTSRKGSVMPSAEKLSPARLRGLGTRMSRQKRRNTERRGTLCRPQAAHVRRL
jgi:hypothetical protein